MSFGLGGFGTGPYGAPSPVTATEPLTTAVSCRQIDGVTRDYVTDTYGNPVAMDGAANRVYLLLSYADPTVPEIITAQGLAQRQAAVTAALAPLVSSGAISKLVVSYTDDGGSHVSGTVSYWDEGTQAAVTLPVN